MKESCLKKNGYKRKKDIVQVNKVFDTAQRYSLKHPHTKWWCTKSEEKVTELKGEMDSPVIVERDHKAQLSITELYSAWKSREVEHAINPPD